MMTRTILFLATDFLGKPSGIGRYNQMVCKALLNEGDLLIVIALTDPLEEVKTAQQSFPDVYYYPCGGSRHKFIIQVILQTLHFQPSLVWTGHVNLTPIGLVISRFCQMRMVTTIHGIDVWNRLPVIRKWALYHSDRIFSVSHFTAQCAAKVNHVDETKVRILSNCLHTNVVHSQSNGNDTMPILLTVGRISQAEQYKGHDFVIRAMPSLLLKFPLLRYNIVGDGDGRLQLEKLANQLCVGHAVHFYGVVSEEELQHHYEQSTIFIMPSTGEGFGIVFIEAMVRGLPVIGGNIDATPEVIIDGETGFTVNPTSVDEIVMTVSRLLDDKDLRHHMAIAGKAHVYKKFSFARFKVTLEQHLAELEIS